MLHRAGRILQIQFHPNHPRQPEHFAEICLFDFYLIITFYWKSYGSSKNHDHNVLEMDTVTINTYHNDSYS